MKWMKERYKDMEEINSLREVRALKRLSSHKHIISLIEVLYDEPTQKLALVFELMEMNLYEAIKDRRKYLAEQKVKIWMYQILKALEFMHRSGIFHRDIKPENILLRDNNVKLADLGSCKGMYAKPPFTEYISTRWYRSPECLLTDGYYNYKMDIWGLGCVFFEMLTLTPLFPGDDELDQVNKINQILGSPSDELFEKFVKNSAHRDEFNFEYQKGVGIQKYLTHVSSKCVDVISKMLIYDPDQRYTAKQCLNHPYFKDLVEQEEKMSKMSLINFRHNPLSMLSINESASCIKIDDSMQNGQNNCYNIANPNAVKTLKAKKDQNSTNLSIHGNYVPQPQGSLPKILLVNTKLGLILPDIKLNNINEDSKGEDSFNKGKKKLSDNNNLVFPKLMHQNRFLCELKNPMNSNEFKKLKHNFSNHSIDKGLSNGFTQYDKKPAINIKKRIKEVKKNYVSPYSKKNIENNVLI